MNNSKSNSVKNILLEYVEKGRIDIPEDTLTALISTHGYRAITRGISSLIQEETILFPYKKRFTKKADIIKSFKALQNHDPEIIYPDVYIVYNMHLDNPKRLLYGKQYMLMIRRKDDYTLFGAMTDYFNEMIRVQCKRSDHKKSTIEAWQSDSGTVVRRAMSDFHKVDSQSLREAIFRTFYEVGNFRVSVAHNVIQIMRATRILDPCAGWGDRLIGALSCSNVRYYCGVDPNKGLFKGYKRMIETFSPLRETILETNMINQPFEDADIPDKEYDLIFTSPPYFTLEEYRGGDMSLQSSSRYPTLDKWLNKFLFPSLKKAWAFLQENGHMVIVINDSPNLKFVENMLNYVDGLSNCKYRGCISYAEYRGKDTNSGHNLFGSPQPMWIWKKIPKK